MSNVIASELQLTEILDVALEEFERHLLPLSAFATSYGSVELAGDDTITVPFYPIDDNESQSRAEGEKYSEKVTGTETLSRQITPNKNKIQGLSFTPEHVRRQPFNVLNTEKHGRNKGRKLAYDVIKDIFSIIRRSNFENSVLGAQDPAAFDAAEVRALRRDCNDRKWPSDMRSLMLDSELYSEILGDTTVLDLSQSGAGGVLREGELPRMFGFGVGEALGMHTNDSAVTALTSVTNATNLFTLTGHDLADGDIVQFSATTLPTGLSAATDYYVINAATNTFQVSATAGGSAVAISDDGTAVSVQRFERLGGFVAYESAILTAFAPVAPTGAIAGQLHDYRQVTSSSGLVLEYKHFGDADSSKEYQIIECHYGYALGQEEALLRIEKQA